MAVVTPQTDLYLLKCPLEIDQQNQLTFSNATAQYNYFNNLPKRGNTDFTYQRKDGVIRFNADIEDIRGYNYCMYRNDAYSNKWFYAFITDMKYANDGVTFITLKTDVWQTWLFDINVKSSYVVREHVNDDTIGKHTLDENLSIGEPINNATVTYTISSPDNDMQRMVAQVTELPEGVTVPTGYTNRIYTGIPQGSYFVVINGYGDLQVFTKWYDVAGKANAIVSIFIVPYAMVSNAHNEPFTVKHNGTTLGNATFGFLPTSYDAKQFNFNNVTYSPTLNGYTPKNNKLYCYPYSYLEVTNSCGTDVIFHYEDFGNPTSTQWNCYGVLTQGCSIRMYPANYKKTTGFAASYAYGIPCGKLPQISWQSDYYLNWQAQNATNVAVQSAANVVGGAGQVAGSMIAASEGGRGSGISGIFGGVGSLISSVGTAMQEHHVADLVPIQERGATTNADLTYVMDKIGFTFHKMSLRAEYAQMIDHFFSMFGYKVNEMKVPNVYGRSNWNYVQCIQANIIGDVPQDDMNEIKELFNTGITFWHNPSTYLDYSQTNSIV